MYNGWSDRNLILIKVRVLRWISFKVTKKYSRRKFTEIKDMFINILLLISD